MSEENNIEKDYYTDIDPDFEDYVWKFEQYERQIKMGMALIALIGGILIFMLLMYFLTRTKSGIYKQVLV